MERPAVTNPVQQAQRGHSGVSRVNEVNEVNGVSGQSTSSEHVSPGACVHSSQLPTGRPLAEVRVHVGLWDYKLKRDSL